VKSRTHFAKINMVTGFLNRVIILGLPFVIRTIVIRKLGAEYLGLSSLFSSILQVLNMAELGFSSAVVFSLYKPMAEDNTDEICALLSFYRNVYKIIGIVILACGGLLTPFLPYLIRGSYPSDINIYILYWMYLVNTSISYLCFAYKNVIFSASQRQDILNNVNSVVSISKFIIQIVILLIFQNYYFYIIWNVVFTLVENLAVAILTKKYHPEYVCRGNIGANKKNEITKQIKGLAVGQITKVSRNSFDSIVISMFCGLTMVTIYSNYYYVLNAVIGIISILTTSISAGVGNSIASDTIEKNYRDFKKFYYYFSLFGGVCTICFFYLYQPFIELWVGEELKASLYTMSLFCVYFYIIQMGLVRSVYANAAGIWWETRYVQIAEMISNIVLNFVLGYFFGVNGILIATIVTMTLFCVIGLTKITFEVYFGNNYLEYIYLSLKYIIYTVITTIVCGLFEGFLDGYLIINTWISFFVRAFIIAFFALFFYIIISFVEKNNYFYMRELISKLRRS